MTKLIHVLDDSLNNTKPNTVVVFEGELIFSGREVTPLNVIELLESGRYAESWTYQKVKTQDLEDWKEVIYGK